MPGFGVDFWILKSTVHTSDLSICCVLVKDIQIALFQSTQLTNEYQTGTPSRSSFVQCYELSGVCSA